MDIQPLTEDDEIMMAFEEKNWSNPYLQTYELDTKGIPKDLLHLFLYIAAYQEKKIWFFEIASRLNVPYLPDMEEFIMFPLHTAIRLNNSKLFLHFFNHINLQDWQGKTPLHVAIQLNRIDMANYLLLKDAATDLQDYHGRTLLNFSVSSQNIDFVSMFINHYNPKLNPIFEAIELKREDMITLIAQHHPDTLTSNTLVVAIKMRSPELIQLLLKLGSPKDENVYYQELLVFREMLDEDVHQKILSLI